MEQWPPVSHNVLFGDLPIITAKVNTKPDEQLEAAKKPGRRLRFNKSPGVEVISKDPVADSERLLKQFLEQAYCCPVNDKEVNRFLPVVHSSLKAGYSFTDAMIAACYRRSMFC